MIIIIKEMAGMVQSREEFKEEAADGSKTVNPDGVELMHFLRKGLWSE